MHSVAKIVGEYDQEIPQSQTADNPVAPQYFNVIANLFIMGNYFNELG